MAFLAEHWVTCLMLPYMLVMAALAVMIVSENRNPVRSLAWITVLLFLPVIGVILYIFFGRSIKNTRMISRRNRRKLKKKETVRPPRLDRLDLSDESKRLIHLSQTLTDAYYYTGNKATIFTDGTSKFNSLKRDLQAAQRYICLQYYIFLDDNIGRSIRDILIDRARAGVSVRVIYDDVGCFGVDSEFFEGMRREGILVSPFFKVNFPNFASKVNWRNHRKICIIDGKVGYIGGMNIGDRYIDGGNFPEWRDTHLRITGPAVAALQYSFAVDWNFMGLPLIEEESELWREPPQQGGAVMQMLTSGPVSQWPNLAFLFLNAITSAKQRVFIQTPYFLPTESLLRALQTAALSGVDVRIMIPLRSDSKLLTNASASYITECLQSGIKVYFYEAGMLHAKMLIVDNEFTSIGSTNFDFRSFEHNFEANMQIFSKEFCARAAQIYTNDLKKSTRVDAVKWKKRPMAKRAAQSLLRLLSPIL